jgi:hypothetical protein
MKKKSLFHNIRIGATIAAVFYAVYYLLLANSTCHLSISHIISYSHHLDIKHHLIVLGLLPIYIAVMIFGAVLVSIYISSTLQSLFLFIRKIIRYVRPSYLNNG